MSHLIPHKLHRPPGLLRSDATDESLDYSITWVRTFLWLILTIGAVYLIFETTEQSGIWVLILIAYALAVLFGEVMLRRARRRWIQKHRP